jgi:hypothetical protein
MSHSHFIGNVVFVCDGDPRGGDVDLRIYNPEVDVEAKTHWDAGIRPEAVVMVPFDVLAEFVGRIAKTEKAAEIEAMSGVEFLGLGHQASRHSVVGTETAARKLDQIARHYGWWPAAWPTFDDMGPIERSEFLGVVNEILLAAASR